MGFVIYIVSISLLSRNVIVTGLNTNTTTVCCAETVQNDHLNNIYNSVNSNSANYSSSMATLTEMLSNNNTGKPGNTTKLESAATYVLYTLGISAILLNSVFIYAMCRNNEDVMPYHRFMKGLSIADILASFAFLVTGTIPRNSKTTSFIVGYGLPYVLRGFPWVFFTAYFLTLTCLSVNQYVAVCRPWKYSKLASPRMVYYCIVVVWLVSSLQMVIPLFVMLVLNTFDDVAYASKILFQVASIEMQAWMAIFIISTFVNITLNSMMYKKIRELKWKRRLSTNSQETLNIRIKQEAFVTICLLLVTAILLRLPFPIFAIITLQAAGAKIDEHISSILTVMLLILLYTNFFADPIIYISRMREAREFIRVSSSACVSKFGGNGHQSGTQNAAAVSLITDNNERTTDAVTAL